MKLKDFDTYLQKRLNKKEVDEIKYQAQLEKKVFMAMQKEISKAMHKYMKDNNLEADDLASKLDINLTNMVKIQKGEANLTLSNLAHLFASIGEEPHLVFRKKSKA